MRGDDIDVDGAHETSMDGQGERHLPTLTSWSGLEWQAGSTVVRQPPTGLADAGQARTTVRVAVTISLARLRRAGHDGCQPARSSATSAWFR